MKVSYQLANGYSSKAYLNDPVLTAGEPLVCEATDAYTDEPVTVALTDGGWLEVPSA